MNTTFKNDTLTANDEILFNNFKREALAYESEMEVTMNWVLKSGWYILGNELAAFEKNFAEYVGTEYCVGVASGTDAIALGLMAHEIGPGDEVITTNITAFPTITAIVQTGATPVVVDIDEETGLIDPAKISAKISDKTRAIVPVHLYGQSCDMTEIMRIANAANLIVIEDCAQATGASYQDKKCGSIGHCGAFSFYPTKNLGAYGDAGAVTTNDKAVYEKLKSIRNYGQTKRYYHDHSGINSRLDEIQAAILSVKLKYLEQRNERRREIADAYRHNLRGAVCLLARDYGQHAYHLFVLKSGNRDGLMQHLKECNIQSLIHYPVPINQQKSFKGQKEELFPASERFANSILSIPIDPFLTNDEVIRIINAINEFN